MIRRPPLFITLLLLAGPWSEWALAQSIPTAIPYTGSVAVDGIPFNGNGQFKFAIVNQNGTTTYWSNDNTSASGSEPAGAVTIAVSDGLYALELGDPDHANMQPIPPSVFDPPATFLRVWFSDGVNGFQLLSPDRQLVSVPYAYQAEKANEVSGFGTVVKSIGLAGSADAPLRDEIVLEGEGSVQIQRPAGTNMIRIVGTVDTGGAVTDVACPTACISPDEISGPLTDALIPDLGTLSGTVTDAQIPDLNTLSGVLLDTQIPPAISRDNEVTAGVSAAISAHAATANAHPLSTYTAGTLAEARIDALIARDSEVSGAITAHELAADAHSLSSFTQGTLAEARIDAAIARDSEVPGLVGTTVNNAIATHSANASAHHAKTTSFTELTDSIADGQIPAAVTRDAEVPGLASNTVNSAIATHSANASAHHAKTTSFTELTDSIADGQIPPAVTRDVEVPGLIGTAVDSAITTHAANASAHHAKITSFTELTDSIASAQIPTDITHGLNVTGTVTVASLAAGYERVVMPNQSVPPTVTVPTTVTAQCSSGTNVLGGGYDHDDVTGLVTILGSWPNNGNSWSVKVSNMTGANVDVDIYAVCAAIQ